MGKTEVVKLISSVRSTMLVLSGYFNLFFMPRRIHDSRASIQEIAPQPRYTWHPYGSLNVYSSGI